MDFPAWLPSLQEARCGFDLEAAPPALCTLPCPAGSGVEWRGGGDEACLRVHSTTAPVRRLRVLEGRLDPRRFPPGRTILKCCGAMSPGDPAINVPIAADPAVIAADPNHWRYHERRRDGTVRFRSELMGLFFCPHTEWALMIGFPEPFHPAARIHAELRPGDDAIHVRAVSYPGIAMSASTMIAHFFFDAFAPAHDAPPPKG
ncbi:MAG: hypothetical protein ACREJ2_18300 [Planctomycetota bacterium]